MQRQPAAELCVRSSSTPALSARLPPQGRSLGQFWVDVPALSPFLYHYRRPSGGQTAVLLQDLFFFRTALLCGHWLVSAAYCGPFAVVGAAAGSLQVVWCVQATHWHVTICSRHALQDNLSCCCQAFVLGRLQVRAVAAQTQRSSHGVITHTCMAAFLVLLWMAMCGTERLLVFLLWCCTGCTCCTAPVCYSSACLSTVPQHAHLMLACQAVWALQAAGRALPQICFFSKTMNALLSLLHKRVCLLACPAWGHSMHGSGKRNVRDMHDHLAGRE